MPSLAEACHLDRSLRFVAKARTLIQRFELHKHNLEFVCLTTHMYHGQLPSSSAFGHPCLTHSLLFFMICPGEIYHCWKYVYFFQGLEANEGPKYRKENLVLEPPRGEDPRLPPRLEAARPATEPPANGYRRPLCYFLAGAQQGSRN